MLCYAVLCCAGTVTCGRLLVSIIPRVDTLSSFVDLDVRELAAFTPVTNILYTTEIVSVAPARGFEDTGIAIGVPSARYADMPTSVFFFRLPKLPLAIGSTQNLSPFGWSIDQASDALYANVSTWAAACTYPGGMGTSESIHMGGTVLQHHYAKDFAAWMETSIA